MTRSGRAVPGRPEPRWYDRRQVALALFAFTAVWVLGMLTGVIPDAIEYMIGDYTVTVEPTNRK